MYILKYKSSPKAVGREKKLREVSKDYITELMWVRLKNIVARDLSFLNPALLISFPALSNYFKRFQRMSRAQIVCQGAQAIIRYVTHNNTQIQKVHNSLLHPESE